MDGCPPRDALGIDGEPFGALQPMEVSWEMLFRAVWSPLLLFLLRVDPKKRLDPLLAVLATVGAQHPLPYSSLRAAATVSFETGYA